MTLEENKALVQQFIEEILNQGNTGAIAEFCVPGSFLAGGLVGQIKSLKTAFPDFHFTVAEIVAEENQVAVRGTGRGTNSGPLVGLPAFGRLEQPVPPTGKLIMNTAMYLFTLSGGKIVSMASELDQIGCCSSWGGPLRRPKNNAYSQFNQARSLKTAMGS